MDYSKTQDGSCKTARPKVINFVVAGWNPTQIEWWWSPKTPPSQRTQWKGEWWVKDTLDNFQILNFEYFLMFFDICVCVCGKYSIFYNILCVQGEYWGELESWQRCRIAGYLFGPGQYIHFYIYLLPPPSSLSIYLVNISIFIYPPPLSLSSIYLVNISISCTNSIIIIIMLDLLLWCERKIKRSQNPKYNFRLESTFPPFYLSTGRVSHSSCMNCQKIYFRLLIPRVSELAACPH